MILGITGNILTVLVLRQRKFRNQNMRMLFVALAVVDTFWLIFMPSIDIYEVISKEQLQDRSLIS